MMAKSYEEISIPRKLADKLSKRAKETRFSSLSSYAAYVLRQVVSNLETEERAKNKAYSEKDEKKVKEKLKKLGYLS